jgi:hypothetical protein
VRTAQVIPSHHADTAEQGAGGGSTLTVIFIEPVPRTDPALRARVVNRYGSVLDNLPQDSAAPPVP